MRIIGVDAASGPDITALRCPSCHKGSTDIREAQCAHCKQWWRDNRTTPDYSTITKGIVEQY